MTLEQAIKAYARACNGEEDVARTEVLNFLQLDSADEAELPGEVRMVLVSADFSTELTTAVLWLNQHDLDILHPAKTLTNASNVVPLNVFARETKRHSENNGFPEDLELRFLETYRSIYVESSDGRFA